MPIKAIHADGSETIIKYQSFRYNKIGELNQSKWFRDAVNYLKDNYSDTCLLYSSGKKMKAACGMFY